MYRVHIVYDRRPLVLVLPALMYLASICAIFSGFDFLAAHTTTSDGNCDPLQDLQTRLQLILWCCSQLRDPILRHFCGT